MMTSFSLDHIRLAVGDYLAQWSEYTTTEEPQTVPTSHEYIGHWVYGFPYSGIAAILLFPFLLQFVWYLVKTIVSAWCGLLVGRPQAEEDTQLLGDEISITSSVQDNQGQVATRQNRPSARSSRKEKKERTQQKSNTGATNPRRANILDIPIIVKKERAPKRARTRQQKERAIKGLMKQTGCAREDATEVLRRRIAKERAIGCY